MHPLRTAHRLPHLARLVLAWFVLTLGAAVLSPALGAGALQMVCTGDGMKVVAVDADGQAIATGTHTLDCPLCVAVGAPPPTSTPGLATRIAHAAPERLAAIDTPPATPAGAPLPARGPPTRS